MSRLRVSSFHLRYGPNFPLLAMISPPSGCSPTRRGRRSSCSASSSVSVDRDIVWKSEDIFGFVSGGSVSASPSCTYGPKRPLFAYTGRPVSGSSPSGSPPFGADRISTARSMVSSSSGRSSGTDAVSSPRRRYGPVPAVAHDDRLAVLVDPDRDGVDGLGVRLLEGLLLHRQQARVAVAEPELVQPRHPLPGGPRRSRRGRPPCGP